MAANSTARYGASKPLLYGLAQIGPFDHLNVKPADSWQRTSETRYLKCFVIPILATFDQTCLTVHQSSGIQIKHGTGITRST